MDHFLTEFQTNFYIGCLLLLSNIFIHLAKMIETEANLQAVDQAPISHSEELEFDCPSSFNFKDPNVDDFNLNTLFGRCVFDIFTSSSHLKADLI